MTPCVNISLPGRTIKSASRPLKRMLGPLRPGAQRHGPPWLRWKLRAEASGRASSIAGPCARCSSSSRGEAWFSHTAGAATSGSQRGPSAQCRLFLRRPGGRTSWQGRKLSARRLPLTPFQVVPGGAWVGLVALSAVARSSVRPAGVNMGADHYGCPGMVCASFGTKEICRGRSTQSC